MSAINVNEWLDEYNDYMLLYRIFGDANYLAEAAEVMQSLKAYVARLQRIADMQSQLNQASSNASQMRLKKGNML
ncbi:hypothetical protein SD70_23030 [Gordoniibacillus kamchatkensis]|uniref:Uncharacterized protein n=1 Tax=Gordoniibacillus kamchatkensis TaxID=1590651 RepID=A0ABR5ADG0_9BACL|nr:hypothetical protein [Paenibacillus sp. VKM B-2647]KIL38932.1 hypothetical protein SD70_23030 [Paenibacillus sp. VKM B-2647]